MARSYSLHTILYHQQLRSWTSSTFWREESQGKTSWVRSFSLWFTKVCWAKECIIDDRITSNFDPWKAWTKTSPRNNSGFKKSQNTTQIAHQPNRTATPTKSEDGTWKTAIWKGNNRLPTIHFHLQFFSFNESMFKKKSPYGKKASRHPGLEGIHWINQDHVYTQDYPPILVGLKRVNHISDHFCPKKPWEVQSGFAREVVKAHTCCWFLVGKATKNNPSKRDIKTKPPIFTLQIVCILFTPKKKKHHFHHPPFSSWYLLLAPRFCSTQLPPLFRRCKNHLGRSMGSKSCSLGTNTTAAPTGTRRAKGDVLQTLLGCPWKWILTS